MKELLLHPATSRAMDKLLLKPSHAILLVGTRGAGKTTLATYLMSKLLGINNREISSHPYFFTIKPENRSISIDAVRKLQEFMKLKTVGHNEIRRGVIISEADSLTIEAQNALLKLLEEPPLDTIIILTSLPNQLLLPTITSRTQSIVMATPKLKDAINFFSSKGYTQKDIERNFYISGGQVGLMTALLDNSVAHPLAIQISNAKEVLTSPLFKRLCLADVLSKQKELLPDLLFGLEQVCHAALAQSARAEREVSTRKWINALRRILHAKADLTRNPQSKLLLSDLFLNL